MRPVHDYRLIRLFRGCSAPCKQAGMDIFIPRSAPDKGGAVQEKNQAFELVVFLTILVSEVFSRQHYSCGPLQCHWPLTLRPRLQELLPAWSTSVSTIIGALQYYYSNYSANPRLGFTDGWKAASGGLLEFSCPVGECIGIGILRQQFDIQQGLLTLMDERRLIPVGTAC